MKYVFLCVFLALTALSAVRYFGTQPESGRTVVLSWVTDSNPAREEQIHLFHKWLKENGKADIEIVLDTANSDPAKRVIQGVSGVAGDIIDMNSNDLPFFVSTGLLADLTGAGRSMGFGPDQTYPALRSLIELNGRQYRFPCNVGINVLWANKATFERYSQRMPPAEWDFDQFEKFGKEFVAAANPRGQRHTVFYVDSLEPAVLRRSLGLDTFNETLTRCALDDVRYVQIIERLRKWTYDDHILPTATDIDSFSTDAGYGGAVLQLFNSGNYAMMRMGRHALVQLWAFGDLPLAVTPQPNGGFHNVMVSTRSAGLYAGSKHIEAAQLFFKFLASEEYNSQVVADADALPPNPLYAHGEKFDRPPAHPNEWACHQAFTREVEDAGIAPSFSPFVLPSIVDRVEQQAYDGYFRSGRLTAAAAAHEAAQRIDAEIARSISEDPKLRAEYEDRLSRQQRIDALRASGKKVPLAWIDNLFHRVYYQAQGWAE